MASLWFRCQRRGNFPWRPVCFVGLVGCCWAAVAVAGAPSGAPSGADALLEERLDCGEFAPAFEQARLLADPVERDGLLKRVAQAQAGAGERAASLATIGSMRDDLARGAALDDIATRTPSGGRPEGAPGGGGMNNFGELIELITSTIKPESWDETGGPGTIKSYQNGVYVDPTGVVRPVTDRDGGSRLAEFRRAARRAVHSSDARRTSPSRKVSLNRLERAAQLRLAAGRALDEDMFVLAGLQRVEYVLAYPETGDIVLAGPAADWKYDRENRIVGADTGRPVLQLDDLVVLARHFNAAGGGASRGGELAGGELAGGEFGCSIDPTEKGLAKARAFAEASSAKPLKPGQRGKWLEQLRSQIGMQDVRVFGIDGHSRVAQVIVEADYRMKLIGIGLEEGTADVPSYLRMIQMAAGESPRPMDVLRWWFTVNYDAVLTSPDRDVFEIRGQGVKVLGENEMLTAAGKQIHTDNADPLNAEFAHNFTRHFTDLAAKYPIYAELQNVFDLALVASLLKSEGLADQVGWHMRCFGDPNQYTVARFPVPKAVDTVINHRVVHGKQILAAVSGGVTADFRELVTPDAIAIDRKGALGSRRSRSAPDDAPHAAWWWD